MQVTLYYNDEDRYLIDLVEHQAQRERKSRSAVVLSILEQYYEEGKRLGEILVDLGQVTQREVEQALQLQTQQATDKPLGQILIENGWADEQGVSRALVIQGRLSRQ
ncbi:MAG: hypothetical protein ACP5G2_06455 [Candidatus Bipolaricaulaceae bacterium]